VNSTGNRGESVKASPLEVAPDELIKNTERKVNSLIEESALFAADGDFSTALDKAKEACKKERLLAKQREQLGLEEQLNLDLTYYVLLNLANQYESNKMYSEALNSYNVIVKNKLFPQSGRLRVNMGNVYFNQGKYSQAIKLYRMALDQIPNTNKGFRQKITKNIATAFVKMGNYLDAIASLESIVDSSADHDGVFNLLLCFYAMGDKEKMKRTFQTLISIPHIHSDQDEEIESRYDSMEDHEVFDQDGLREIARERKLKAQQQILHAAKLIAPNVEVTSGLGFDWIVDELKNSPNSDIASELEIAKAVHYLRTKNFSQAIETLKMFEKRDKKLVGTATTNLAFLYFLQGDYKLSEQYAQRSIDQDRYNAKSHTNLGNCYFAKENYQKAREHYNEAISVDALCIEAMYNLGKLILSSFN
jgi:intraflagellar transport protein 88